MGRETEIKVRVEDLDQVRERLQRHGATVVQTRAFEDNLLLEEATRPLTARGENLRIRLSAGRALLTWKGPKTVTAGVRSREEIETWCDDAEALIQLFDRLGLRRTFRYQKYRETWRLGAVEVMLDETPVGTFVEIEGDDADVRAATARLELDPDAVEERSYPALFQDLLREQGSTSGDMVFVDHA